MHPSVMTKYKYEDLTTPMPATLYTCDGLVQFHTRRFVTGWHGSFLPDARTPGRFVIHFDREGDPTNLKTTVVHWATGDTLTGTDYAYRDIVMTPMETTQYCGTCEVWHTVGSKA